jgi:hypothetical protein
MAIAAMLIPVSAIAVVGISGTAGAGTGKIECTTITGNLSSTIVVSGCTGGNTGGTSEPFNALDLATGGTIPWTSGSTTTIAAPTVTPVAATKCPGYVRNGPSNPSAESFSAAVTGDTGDGILLPGLGVGSVCIASDGTITQLKKTEISWTSSSLSCTTITGNIGNTIVVSGCTGGDTGGMSNSFTAIDLATGGTIPWSSGGSTTIGSPTVTATSATKCPDYVRGGANNPSAEKISGAVTADTGDGLKLPGTFKGAVCIQTDGTITALSALAAK